jgi:hypothetical protein
VYGHAAFVFRGVNDEHERLALLEARSEDAVAVAVVVLALVAAHVPRHELQLARLEDVDRGEALCCCWEA